MLKRASVPKISFFRQKSQIGQKTYIGPLLSWKLNIFDLARATSQLGLAANVV